MNTYVIYFFLVVTAIWLYRLLAYFYDDRNEKASGKQYKTAYRRRLNRY